MKDKVLINVRTVGKGSIDTYAPRGALVEVGPDKLRARIKPIYDFFTKKWKNEKKKKLLLEEIVKSIQVLDESYEEVRRVFGEYKARYHKPVGVYLEDYPIGFIQVLKDYLNEPGVLEHELIHLLGEKYIWQGIIPKRIINQDAITAYATTALLDKEDIQGFHKLGTATKKDFLKIKLYKLIPTDYQEFIKGFRTASIKIGNYARELANGDLEKGLNLICEVAK